mgnify:CR=1 FL=1
MRVVCYVFLLLVTGYAVRAQQGLTLQGYVTGTDNSRVAFANLFLKKAEDSVLIRTAVADSTGFYFFEQVPGGEYFISITTVGYEPYLSVKFSANPADDQVLKLPDMILQRLTREMNAIQLIAQRPFIEQQIDKMIVNVDKTIVSSGNSVIEILEKSPGVIVDQQNEQIRLRNRSGVIFMIDGKQNFLSGSDLFQFLRGLNSEQVDKIEIITNPSAKYDAAGNAGIINIRLKKNTAFGTNGTAAVAISRGIIPDAVDDLWRGTINISLNHRSKKLNLFGNAGLLRDGTYSGNTLTRTFSFQQLNSFFRQGIDRGNRVSNGTARAGADYSFSEKTNMGITVDYSVAGIRSHSDNETMVVEKQNGMENSFFIRQQSRLTSKRSNTGVGISFRHLFDKQGKELTIDADLTGFRNISPQEFASNFFDASGAAYSQLLQQSDIDSRIRIFAVKSDLVLPLKNKGRVETGAKFSRVNIDNDFRFEHFSGGSWQNDPGMTNRFLYTERISAAYLNASSEWGIWQVQAGIRAEHTFSTGKSVTINQRTNRSYLSLFPSLFVLQKMDDKQSLRYSYSRRIDRPGYDRLNPFILVIDPYTYKTGNPYLQPQFTHIVEVNYTYKTLTAGASYAHTNSLMFELTDPNDSTRITKTVEMNLSSMRSYTFNMMTSFRGTAWWSGRFQGSIFYNRYKDDDVLGGHLATGRVSFNGNLSQNFTLPKKWTAELSVIYNSPFVQGIIDSDRSLWTIHAGVQKSFEKNNGRLRLHASDILLSSFIRGTVNYQNANLSFNPRYTTRRITLSYSRSFGSKTVKAAKQRRTASETEATRVSGQ